MNQQSLDSVQVIKFGKSTHSMTFIFFLNFDSTTIDIILNEAGIGETIDPHVFLNISFADFQKLILSYIFNKYFDTRVYLCFVWEVSFSYSNYPIVYIYRFWY